MNKIIRVFLPLIISILFIPLNLQAHEYASMYINNTSTPSALSLTANTWATVGGGTAFTTGYTSTNWSYSSNVLTATSSADGNYTVMFSLSFNGSEIGNYDVGISVGGANPTTYYTQRAIANTNKEIGNVSGVINVTIAEGARTISLKVRSSVNANLETWNAQVTVVEHEEPASNIYAEMNISGGATPTGTQSSSWTKYPVTGGSNFSAGLTNGFTAGTSELTVSSTGKYLAVLSASATSEFSGAGYNFGVSIGSSDPVRVVARRYFSTTGQVGVIYTCGILNLTTDNVITVKTQQVSGASNKILTLNNASLILVKIDNATTSTSPYGGMYTTGNSTATAVDATNTWYQVTAGMGAMNNNLFTHSGGTLTPTGLSAGIYLVNYSAGLLAPSGNPIQVYTSIFVNGSEQTDLTTVRNISSATSVGSIGGTGLISLSQDDSDQPVIMQIKNVTPSSTDDVTVKFTGISLQRILITGDGSLPVELTGFAVIQNGNTIHLNWSTASETDNLGFILESRNSRSDEWHQIADYKSNPELVGQGSTTQATDYSFIDPALASGGTRFYRLSDISYSGERNYYQEISLTLKPQEASARPELITIKPPYPNPFNPVTKLEYYLERDIPVNVNIYNIRGELVNNLVTALTNPGWNSITWNATDSMGRPVSTGIYLVEFQAGNLKKFKKVILIK